MDYLCSITEHMRMGGERLTSAGGYFTATNRGRGGGSAAVLFSLGEAQWAPCLQGVAPQSTSPDSLRESGNNFTGREAPRVPRQGTSSILQAKAENPTWGGVCEFRFRHLCGAG